MMGTPKDLCDFAIGFSLNEGIVDSIDEIENLEIIEAGDGIELRMWIAQAKSDLVSAGRRRIAGPTGCGICGSESIAAAVRLVPSVPESRGRVYSTTEIMDAMASVAPLQELNGKTRGTHAAAFWSSESVIVALREDVGRHNALDKLAGALAQGNVSTTGGMVLLTSRVSVEMVQKTAALGASLLVAVSAPTALAVRTAELAGVTLCAVARSDEFEVFSQPRRVATVRVPQDARH